MWKVDAFCHILPLEYVKAMAKYSKKGDTGVYHATKVPGVSPQPTITNLDERFRQMDKYDQYLQLINISLPAPEDITDGQDTIDLARIGNDALAELVYRYPDRFVAATGCLPMNNIDAAMTELDRCIKDLKFRGVQINTTIGGKPLDDPEYDPLWAKMNEYNLPVQIHPRHMVEGIRQFSDAEIPEDRVEFWARMPYNWPFETTIAMGRLVYSGILEKYPDLKILTHHCGGVTPFHILRETWFHNSAEMRFGVDVMPEHRLREGVLANYKKFYVDTACYGATATLMCGYELYGAEHMLFATDIPYDSMGGARLIPETIRSIEEMNISEGEKKAIFCDNAIKLFNLPL